MRALRALFTARTTMKRSARPFTVEIKPSRRSPQNAAPILNSMSRTAPPPLHLWSSDRQGQDNLRERSPASLAALDEANRLFAKLKAGPVSAQSPDPRPPERVAVQAQQPAFDEPKADPPGRVQDTGRRGGASPARPQPNRSCQRSAAAGHRAAHGVAQAPSCSVEKDHAHSAQRGVRGADCV